MTATSGQTATRRDGGMLVRDGGAMLTATERPSMVISAIVTHHLAAAVAGIVAAATALFALVEASSGETIGIGSVTALVVTVMGIVFRTQQQQIRSQRVDMARMARRIEHLEHELDMRRDGHAG